MKHRYWNKLAALALSMGLVLSLEVPAFAGAPEPALPGEVVEVVIGPTEDIIEDIKEITATEGTASVPVTLEVEVAMFSVTLPTSLPIDVDANGIVTTASDAKIINNSNASVKVTNMAITAEEGWEIVDFDSADMQREKAGAKKLAMYINGDKTTGTDAISFTQENFPSLPAAGELSIIYDAKLPVQPTAVTEDKIATVVFTVGWSV